MGVHQNLDEYRDRIWLVMLPPRRAVRSPAAISSSHLYRTAIAHGTTVYSRISIREATNAASTPSLPYLSPRVSGRPSVVRFGSVYRLEVGGERWAGVSPPRSGRCLARCGRIGWRVTVSAVRPRSATPDQPEALDQTDAVHATDDDPTVPGRAERFTAGQRSRRGSGVCR